MSSVSIAAIAMRRSIRRCSVPGLYSVKSWAVFVRSRSMISGSQSLCRVLFRRDRSARGASAMRRSYSTSASGIFATGSTRSTAPVMIALRGMPS